MKRKLIYSISLLSILLLAIFVTSTFEKRKDKQLVVYTTLYPLHYFAERIGGSHVQVNDIEEPSFTLSQNEMKALGQSDLLFYIGLGFESFIEDAQQTLTNENVKLVATSDAITEEMFAGEHLEEGHIHDDSSIDPHVWMSPVLSDALAYSIKDALIELLPDKKEEFDKNFEELREELLTLDRKFIETTLNTPIKTISVLGESFGYIADTYGLEQVVLGDLNAQQLASLVKSAKEQGVKYVLSEENVSSGLTETIRKEIGAETLTFHNLKSLTEKELKNGEDYFSVMESNIRTLKKALGGK